MLDKVKFTAGLGLAALLLAAACATGASVSPEIAAERRARLASISLLPDCADAETVTGALTEHIPDCRMKAGPSGLLLAVQTDPVDQEMLGPSGFLSVSVTDRQGQPLAEFSEITNGLYAYPALHDANGDGRQDIVIARSTDAVNRVYSLWLQRENGDFTHAGQLTGHRVSWSSGGMIVAAKRIGASDWDVGYYRIAADKFQEVALVKGEGSEPPKRGGRCEIVRIAPGAEAGRFCSAL
ncbi:MAG: FG-GAP repeat domain-containing protein [Hyphomonas sp.]